MFLTTFPCSMVNVVHIAKQNTVKLRCYFMLNLPVVMSSKIQKKFKWKTILHIICKEINLKTKFPLWNQDTESCTCRKYQLYGILNNSIFLQMISEDLLAYLWAGRQCPCGYSQGTVPGVVYRKPAPQWPDQPRVTTRPACSDRNTPLGAEWLPLACPLCRESANQSSLKCNKVW